MKQARRLLEHRLCRCARCGVFTVDPPRSTDRICHQGSRWMTCANRASCIRSNMDGFFPEGLTRNRGKTQTISEATGQRRDLSHWVHRIGEANRDSNRIEVPFDQIAPTVRTNSGRLETASSELRVPIGRTGATKLQYLAIGKGTCQHALDRR